MFVVFLKQSAGEIVDFSGSVEYNVSVFVTSLKWSYCLMLLTLCNSQTIAPVSSIFSWYVDHFSFLHKVEQELS